MSGPRPAQDSSERIGVVVGIAAEVLKTVENTVLFYPCSGFDWLEPILLFAPYVKEFWFADISYFGNHSPKRARPILRPEDGYSFVEMNVEENIVSEIEWRDDPKYSGVPPCIRTETYHHLESNQLIRVHRHRRRGPTAMRERVDRLGVFFYRGCSNEGSSTLWLTANRNGGKGQIEEVLDRLVDGGLIVTDGSMCEGKSNPYRDLRRYQNDRHIGAKVVELVKPFEDDTGREFSCIGYAGEKNGPTLIWQVRILKRRSNKASATVGIIA